jgi:hypothetical protein
MLRYNVDDNLWAIEKIYEIKKRDMFYKFDDVLRISCYVLSSMKVKFCWAIHDHESKKQNDFIVWNMSMNMNEKNA